MSHGYEGPGWGQRTSSTFTTYTTEQTITFDTFPDAIAAAVLVGKQVSQRVRVRRVEVLGLASWEVAWTPPQQYLINTPVPTWQPTITCASGVN